MLATFFGRWWRRVAPGGPHRSASRSAPPVQDRRLRTLATPPALMGARRPLIAAGRGVAGFEFHVAESMVNRLRRRDDQVAANACTAGVLGAMRLACAERLSALAELPAGWLARIQPDREIVPGMMLVLQPDPGQADAVALPALAQRLRDRGAQVGWRAHADAPPVHWQPDFLLLPGTTQPAALAGWRDQAATLVAIDLPNVDTLDAFLNAGVALATCEVGVPIGGAQALPPQAHGLLQLLNELVQGQDNARVVAAIKADAALGVRLLQHLNSAGATPGRVLDSIDQAVMVLGRDALYRWVAQMLVRLAPPRPSTAGLQGLALSRARLLELLARARGEPNPGGLYLLGLASMLPVLLLCPLNDALRTLSLPPAAVQALTGGLGPWAPYLALALAMEQRDLGETERLAAPWGGLSAVLALSTQAWQQA